MKRKKKSEKAEYLLFGFPINKETIIIFLFVLAVIVAICVLLDASEVGTDNFWVQCSVGFLALCVFLYLLIQGQNKRDKDYEITQLKQEIRKLESIDESNRHIIKLLEAELELVRSSRHN